jgi:hypothetical protein
VESTGSLGSAGFEKSLEISIASQGPAPDKGSGDPVERLEGRSRLELGHPHDFRPIRGHLKIPRREAHRIPTPFTEIVAVWGGSHSVIAPLIRVSSPKITHRPWKVEPTLSGPGEVDALR